MSQNKKEALRRVKNAKKTKSKSLNLRYLDLVEFPKEISKLRDLRKLDLTGNQLISIPESITSLTNLCELLLKDNQLISVPESILELPSLTKLSLSYNQLSYLPEGIMNLGNLKTLYLMNNLLNSLPESITSLKHLMELDLRNNEFGQIPKSITRLGRLEELSMRGNQLTSIPESISQLNNLQRLYLSFNQLTKLPENIFKISSLKELILNDNLLIKISESITQLTNLRNIDLRNNPIKNPPLEVVNQGIKAIREYFGRQKEEGSSKLYEAKVLVVGEGGAGKTSLSQKIIDPKYELSVESKDISTEGIDILRHSFKSNDNTEILINLWDFGGQEIYHSTHQFFLTKRSLYVLVTDSRKDDTDLKYWLNVQQLLAEDSPMLIVQNEKQDRVKELNTGEIKRHFGNVKEILRTNLKNNRGLPEIVKHIEAQIQLMPHIGDSLPKSWVAIRKELEELTVNYISLDEYLDICEKHGINQEKDALILSGYLHDLGVMLHFQDDPILERIVILKNEWGTDAVYKVIDYPKVKENNGQFAYRDLKTIWSDDKYIGKHLELLTLMEKFKLCYNIPNTRNYITPARLPAEKAIYKWDVTNNSQLRYRYKFMPKGILLRLIVQMHPYIKNQKLVWKTGIVLEKNETLAEVVEVFGQNEIQIRLKGKHPDLLRPLIVHQLDSINGTFHNLQVEKLIPCNCERCAAHEQPHFYTDERLLIYKAHHKYEIECPEPPFNKVDVRKLLHDFSLGIEQERGESKYPPLLISYNHKDAAFVDYLESYLEANGVDYWRDVRDAPAGRLDKIVRGEIASRVVLLVFSKNSIKSDWVEYEGQKAREVEQEQGRDALCPITIDDAWEAANWSPVLMHQIQQYHVVDFSDWKKKANMERQFDRLLEGLERNYKKERYD